MDEYNDFDLTLFENKKNKLDQTQSKQILSDIVPVLEKVEDWSVENLNAVLQNYADEKEYKIGKVMWPVRIGVTANVVTPGGSAEMMYLLGKEKSLQRLNRCIERL